MKKTIITILIIILSAASLLFMAATIMAFTQNEIGSGAMGALLSALLVYATKHLINIKNNQKNNLEDTETKEVAGQLSLIKDLEIEKADANIEPKDEMPIDLPIYKDEDIEENTDNNYQEVERTSFDLYEPYKLENQPCYEMFQIFENLSISDEDKRELLDIIAKLYSKYSTVPVYFQSVEYIKDFIETKVDAKHKKNVSILFLQILIERNNALIQEEIVREEEYMYRLKTKKGRLNSIARFKDNLYLYRDYFSPSNIEFLNNKIADLKTRYRLDEGEIIEQ